MKSLYSLILIIASLLISSQAAAWQLYDADHDSLYLWGGTYTHFSDTKARPFWSVWKS